jgi:hypothetical protein
MSILNINGVKKSVTVGGNVLINEELCKYFLKQSANNEYKFFGALTQGKKGTDKYDSYKLSWDILKHNKLTMFVEGATKDDVAQINEIEMLLTNEIIEREEVKDSNFYKLLKNKSNKKESLIEDEEEIKMENKTEVMKEVAVTIDKPKMPQFSNAVKSFMKENEIKKITEALELAVVKYNDALNDIALLEERLVNTNKEVAVTTEDPDDDPNGGQAVPAIDYANLKAELKAEILAELKGELKALSTPAPVETKIEEPRKKLSIKDITLEDLNKMNYKNLQKVGSALKLGEANVSKIDELRKLIAAKLNLTADDFKEEVSISKLEINNKDTSKFDYIRQTNLNYNEDTDDIVEDFDNIKIEKSETEKLKGLTFKDPARQQLANLILNRK